MVKHCSPFSTVSFSTSSTTKALLGYVSDLLTLPTSFVLGIHTSVQSKSNTLPLPQSSNSNARSGNISTQTLTVSDRKRKDTKAVDDPLTAKKPRGRSSNRKIVVQGMVIS